MVGKNGIMCSVMNAKYDSVTKLVTFIYIKALSPMLGTIITIICYYLTIKRINAFQKILSDERELNAGKLFWYPAVMFISFLPSVVYWLLTLCTGLGNTEAIEAFMMLITHSIGFTNALVYGYQRRLFMGQKDQKEKMMMEMSSENIKSKIMTDMSTISE